MLPLPTLDINRFNPDAPIDHLESDSDEGSFDGNVNLNYEHDDLAGEDYDDNEEDDGNEEGTPMNDCSQLKWKFEPFTEVLQQPTNM